MSDASGMRSKGYIIGLDLGQARDFTALVVSEKHEDTKRWPKLVQHNIVHMHRFPLGTPYPDITEAVKRVIAQLPARPQPPILVVDATGVGRPVVDAMKARGLSPIAATITGGADVTEKSPDDLRVPKRILASTLQIALQSGRLKIAANMPLTDVLVRELQSFKVKISVAGNETYEAWREADHDDLVLACGLAVWRGEYRNGEYDESMSWVCDDAGSVNSGFVGHMYSR